VSSQGLAERNADANGITECNSTRRQVQLHTGAWQLWQICYGPVWGGRRFDGTYFYAAGGYSSVRAIRWLSSIVMTCSQHVDAVAEHPQAAIMAVAVYYPTTNKIYVFGVKTRERHQL